MVDMVRKVFRLHCKMTVFLKDGKTMPTMVTMFIEVARL